MGKRGKWRRQKNKNSRQEPVVFIVQKPTNSLCFIRSGTPSPKKGRHISGTFYFRHLKDDKRITKEKK